MKLYIHCLIIIVIFVLNSNAGADERKTKAVDWHPVLFNSIETLPVNKENLSSDFIVNQDGDGLGEELPSSIMYFKKNPKDYVTSMTVTDLSICKRPTEKNICQSFIKMISDVPPVLGTDVTGTRIGGAGYRTVFLARVDSVKFDGIDSLTAFIGADSQDPPHSNIVLYIYAKKGTNLIQLSAPVYQCTAQVEPNQSDISYYKRFCVNEMILKKAISKGKMLNEIFRLKQ